MPDKPDRPGKPTRARGPLRVVQAGEARLACPVCLGAVMVKLRPSANAALTLDHCRRCGGVWFDAGEVPQLRGCKPEALWAHVALRPEAYRMKCHRCQASFERNKPECPACGWQNQLPCPACRARLQPVEQDGLRLDACRRCHGVWFDNTELAEVWNRKVGALVRKPGAPVRGPDVAADYFLLDAVLWAPYVAPDLAAGGAMLVGEAASGVAHVAGGAIEATGELAGSVFDSIADVIGNIFEGLGDIF